ncbi:MAG TPA: acyl-CoA dehydrogenase family protein [Kofleriaceae bacterium]
MQPGAELTEHEVELVNVARRFAAKEILPRRAELDRAPTHSRELVDKFFETGLMSSFIPSSFGGADVGVHGVVLIAEELASVCAGTSTSLMGSYLGVQPLALFGSDAQKDRYLGEFCRKPTIVAFACTEPGAGSDLSAIRSAYKPTTGGFALSGSKCFITNASVADYVVVIARREGTKGLKGLSAFVIARGQPGLSVGKPMQKMGQRAADTADLYFDGVEVPAHALIGREGQGLEIVLGSLTRSRVAVAGGAVGIARGALQYAFEYVKERRQFDKALVEFQAIQFELAALWQQLEAARSLTRRAARLQDLGLPAVGQTCAAKDFAGRVAEQVASRCIELLGGYGYSTEFPLEKMLRDAKLCVIFEGTSNLQKMMIFNQLLKQREL